MLIYNLTQHNLTKEQQQDGIRELPENLHGRVRTLLTFEEMPTEEEIQERAALLANVAVESGAEGVMLGGAPFLMAALKTALQQRGIRTFYSFSQRRSTEVHTEDGKVEKRSIFNYEGLVEV